jgi:hypothetical protein
LLEGEKLRLLGGNMGLLRLLSVLELELLLLL